MSEQAPRIVILAGPNGAGKSTIAPTFLRDHLSIQTYVNADEIAKGLSGFAPETVAFEAGRIMLRRMRQLTAGRTSFAFETTLATRSYAPWLADLRKTGYFIELFFIWLPRVELAIERVADRVKLGGHGIPETVIRRRFQRGRLNLLEIYDTAVDRWFVYNNSSIDGPALIAFRNDGDTIQVCAEELWAEFRRGSNERC